ncbi:mandelate racemase [Candidatus Thiomargarita nelsonii]|uniref:Mandelate racemase n=1 Tax=Candidatus Thiomargarita nelsonii TaxID=1003181 RepID=A0A0A6PKC1_9GAMM|nr:mandelate racemase [Candidatus Thiomargarita nelsonii]
MKITRISVYQVDLPLDKPYWLSGGRLKFEKLDSTIVSIETDEGITGWGEACPWGVTYLPAFAGGIRAGIAELAPAIIGQEPRHLDYINKIMDIALPGHWYIKSALDMACWDILGKSANLPLYALLGGRFSSHVTLHNMVSTGTPEEMLAIVRAGRAKGYTIYSAKIGADVSLDIERIQALLADLPPGESVTFDVNRAWLPDQAIIVMNTINDARPYFEQPCETLEECSTVRRLTRQPIILDECIQSFEDLLLAQRDQIAQAIGLKVGRVGGLTKAKRMRDFCVATGIRMNIEDTGGSVISDTAVIHLAMATPETHRRATWECSPLHSVVTADGGYIRENGKATLPDSPGLGIEPRLAILGDPVAVYS